ncbi:conserved exported protein of unknown function [Candidatus Filomicrobium marinum]|uniref:DUF2380 domain-containing protein n=2 Tax=Filomicrobium TaxID=119044 RepID=A0A0D6JAT1_9HYPH|nr:MULTISPECIES: DUF3280 domain-containing protein [Filomicrobium]MCV0371012.1 DUF3280 domain-containing protein [Filomicrobium sp.]CFX03917.1 conserved exported protein of unknown function [Candidatus Filomicrobium marinum]CPR15939.1 conserved exported protein of unknown function [Candidatus Filomicrobium marinum]SDP42780.1 Protein of unknown function [Filomicrobium insigne]
MILRTVAIYLMLIGFAQASFASGATKTAIFPFEMVIEQQMGGVGLPPVPNEAERARLELITDELKRLLKETGKYEPLDLSSVNSDIEEQTPFNRCDGCEVEVAKKAGAELSVLGVVHEATAVLLNVSIFVRNVDDGTLRNSMAVSIHENDDKGWLRAVRWLVKNRLSDQEPQK